MSQQSTAIPASWEPNTIGLVISEAYGNRGVGRFVVRIWNLSDSLTEVTEVCWKKQKAESCSQLRGMRRVSFFSAVLKSRWIWGDCQRPQKGLPRRIRGRNSELSQYREECHVIRQAGHPHNSQGTGWTIQWTILGPRINATLTCLRSKNHRFHTVFK